jgi:hypothetical protein
MLLQGAPPKRLGDGACVLRLGSSANVRFRPIADIAANGD